MSATFVLPRQTLLDSNGVITPTGSVRFYNAGTSTPRTVYSDSGLTTPIAQPVQADAAGRLPKIYLAVGAYKVTYFSDAAGTIAVYTEDNLDTGIPAGSGALPVASGGTGATTAAGARTNLGAAAQTDLTTLSADVAAIQAQITGVGGTLGDLAGLDQITRAQLAAGFGIVILQGPTIVASSTAAQTISATIPFDDTIPQNTEGVQVLSGNFTPISASSVLVIEMELQVNGNSASPRKVVGALFQDAIANALTAAVIGGQDLYGVLRFSHRMNSPGTSSIAFKVRAGIDVPNGYLNADTGGVRIFGGVNVSKITVTEVLTI